MITRRKWLLSMFSVAAGGVIGARNSGADAAGVASDPFRAELEKLEKESGGRLGVAFLDTATGTHAGQRTGERFPMCSTFKLLATGAVLVRVDQGKERLGRIVRFSQ